MNKGIKIGVVIQARVGSTRLKNKMLLPFGTTSTLIEFIIQRIIKGVDLPVVLATSNSEKDKELGAIAKNMGVSVFYGSENNVLDRFTKAAEKYEFDTVIRICADNPFISSDHINELITQFRKRKNLDYLSFKTKSGTPVMKSHLGFFAEILTFDSLVKAQTLTQDPFYCEHVTNYIYGNEKTFNVDFLPVPIELDREDYRLTLDTLEDYKMLLELEKALFQKHGLDYNLEDILKLVFELGYSEKMSKIIEEQKK